jgi:hypothetical protein
MRYMTLEYLGLYVRDQKTSKGLYIGDGIKSGVLGNSYENNRMPPNLIKIGSFNNTSDSFD